MKAFETWVQRNSTGSRRRYYYRIFWLFKRLCVSVGKSRKLGAEGFSLNLTCGWFYSIATMTIKSITLTATFSVRLGSKA